jgi:hypothetical protein
MPDNSNPTKSLAQTGPDVDASLLALVDRRWTFENAANENPPELTEDQIVEIREELVDRGLEIADEIEAVEAATVAGALAKLKIVFAVFPPSHDYYHDRLLWSAYRGS